MASTYTSSNRFEKQGTGEHSGTWGTAVNSTLDMIDEAIDGYIAIAMADANVTLTSNNASADQSRPKVLKATGAHTSTRDLVAPAVEKVYIVHNATTGGQSIRIKTSGGVAVTIAASAKAVVYCDGTDFTEVISSALTGYVGTTSITTLGTIATGTWNGTTIAVANGGTGSTSASAARTALGLDSMATQSSSSVSISGGTISGGTITGITDLAVADGGTGASTAANARTNLGVTATGSDTTYCYRSNNLSDVTASSARSNLGLGTAAVVNTGTSGGTAALCNGANTWSTQQTFSGTNGTNISSTVTSGTGSFVSAGSSGLPSKVTNTAGASQYLVQLTNASTEIGAIKINSSNNGVDFVGTSDLRLKENIQNIAEAVNIKDIITSLRPVQFNWISGGHPDTGYIAQEYEKVFPNQVSETKDGMKTINLMRMPEPVVVAALQELYQRISILETAGYTI